jgi:hypothetical protein
MVRKCRQEGRKQECRKSRKAGRIESAEGWEAGRKRKGECSE